MYRMDLDTFREQIKGCKLLFYVILIIRVALCGLKQSYER